MSWQEGTYISFRWKSIGIKAWTIINYVIYFILATDYLRLIKESEFVSECGIYKFQFDFRSYNYQVHFKQNKNVVNKFKVSNYLFLYYLFLLHKGELFTLNLASINHNRRRVTDHINEIFGDRWIGNNGSVRWPAKIVDS